MGNKRTDDDKGDYAPLPVNHEGQILVETETITVQEGARRKRKRIALFIYGLSFKLSLLWLILSGLHSLGLLENPFYRYSVKNVCPNTVYLKGGKYVTTGIVFGRRAQLCGSVLESERYTVNFDNWHQLVGVKNNFGDK